MKKIFSLVLLFLPLAGFCFFEYGDITVRNWVNFKYTAYDVTTSRNNGTAPQYTLNSIDDFRSIVSSGEFSFCVYSNRTAVSGLQLSLSAPLSSNFEPVAGSISRLNITNSVFCSTGSVNCVLSPMYFPEVASVYWSAATLFVNGYRGPGVLDVFHRDGGKYYCVNVDFPALVADVISSTNTAFRSSLLSSLSNVGNSLSIIIQSLSDISSRPSPAPDVWTFDQATNFLASFSGNIQLDGFVFPCEDVLDTLLNSPYKSSADPSVRSQYDNYVSSVCRGLPLLQSLNGLSSLVSGNPLGSEGASGFQKLGDQFNRSINNALTGGGSGGGGIAGDIKRLSTNDWTKGVRDQLRDNHDNITNRLAHMFDDAPNSAGRAIRQTADNTSVTAARATDIASKLNGTIHVQVDNPNNIGVVLDGPVTIDTTQFNGVSVPLSGLKDRIDTWYNDWYSFFDISTPAYSWSSFYNQARDFKDQNHADLSAITNSLRGVFSVTGDVSRIYDYLSGSQSNLLEVIASSITNDWDTYYFKRFRRANEFNDEDDQPFTLEGASETVFGRGFDEGEYSKLNWFSRVELLLFQLSAVSSGTNAIESVDIEDDLNDAVDSFNQHGQDFVNASRRVVGVFQLIDGFAASMRAAFGGYSDPVTSGIVLLPAGSWIFDNALVLEVPVTIQNALRLVFQCIWYLSAFVVAWRVVVATWSRVVSFVRWLWSVFDI